MSTAYDGIPSNLSGGLPTPVNIFSSTNTTPITITTATPHGLITGDLLQVNGHQVNTSANGLWTGLVTSPTGVTLVGSTGNGVGGATGTTFNMGFGASFQIPSDGDPAIAASVNVGFEANGDRTALLASCVGSYADLGIVSGPVDPATPFASNPWGSHTFSSTNVWEAVTTTPSPAFTKADFFNGGDVLDITFSLGASTQSVTTGYVYLGMFYEFRASSGTSPVSQTYIPGSGLLLANPEGTPLNANCATLTGKLVVPTGKTTLDLYIYAMYDDVASTTLDLIGPYNPAIRIRRPTGFRSNWP